MPKMSKFFRVAVEGATADGRTIERQQLIEMAASYNPATYAARVNMEHIRGITADKPFRALGDVMALKTEEIELDLAGNKEKRLALFAQITPNDDLLAINAADQKRYTSIEINPNFAATGKAYLMGLAVTDSPASLGTEFIQFVAGQREKGIDPLANRRLSAANLFTAAAETTMEFEEVGAPANETTGLLAAATAFFKQFTDGKPATPAEPAKPANPAPQRSGEAPANDNDARFAQIGEGLVKMAEAVTAMNTGFTAQIGALKTDFAAVKQSIDTTEKPGQFARPPASGGDGRPRADC